MKNKTLQLSVLIICVVLFATIFMVSLSTSATMYKGILAQVQVALCVVLVMTNHRTGYLSVIIMNGFLVVYKIFDMLQSHGTSVGFVIYIITIILTSILYFYMKTNQVQHEELRRQYEELKNTDRVLQEKDDMLKKLAYLDPLTGMHNAHYMQLKINEAIQAGKPFHVIYFDIDNFKQIDDIHGPKAGDQAIITYAERIQSSFSSRYVCVRMKSDKFAVFLEGEHSEDEIFSLIEQLRAVINSPVTVTMQKFNLSASYGIISFPRDGGTADMLLKHAIMAVYKAKGSGKNTFCFFSRA